MQVAHEAVVDQAHCGVVLHAAMEVAAVVPVDRVSIDFDHLPVGRSCLLPQQVLVAFRFDFARTGRRRGCCDRGVAWGDARGSKAAKGRAAGNGVCVCVWV